MDNKGNKFEDYNDTSDVSSDSNSIGYLILGLLLPIIGFIVYLIIRKFKQQASTKLFIGFLIGIALRVIIYYSWLLFI